MKKTILLLVLLPMSLLAQKHDYNWRLGASALNNPLDSNWGTTIMNFNSLSNTFTAYDGLGLMDFDITCTSISNEDGQYLFSYNGMYLEDMNNEVILNSKNLSSSGGDGGDIIPQGGIILPLPESDTKYVLLHASRNYFVGVGVAGHEIHYSIVDMEENNQKGAVVEKRHLLISDTLDGGKLTATRHANGRDWWLLVPEALSSNYYRLLVTPDGVHLEGKQDAGVPIFEGLGQAFFSPDGTRYANFASISDIKGDYINVYDFDRCTGLLSNPKAIHLFNDQPGGISFSPNSNILYLFGHKKVFQYDLTVSDVFATQQLVAETDNYLDTVYFPNMDTTYYFQHAFFLGQLAPDGKIYISATVNNNKLLHTINNPNIWGVGCDVQQHSIHIPTFNRTIPNFPNYRLGPIDGSICDSLGINNVPLSRFRYDQDTSNSLSFDFIDLSNYEPAEWHWDFGDGTTSQDTSPTHLYAGIGVYPVCLTVTNQYGSSTMCDTLYLGVVATQEVDIQVDVHVWPNPFSDYLMVSLYDYYPQNAYIYFYDITGRFLRKERVRNGTNELDVSDFPKGMVFYEVRDGVVLLGRGKVEKE